MTQAEKILRLEEQLTTVMAAVAKLIHCNREMATEVNVLKATAVDFAVLHGLSQKTFLELISKNYELVTKSLNDDDEEKGEDDIAAMVSDIVEAIREKSQCKH